MIYWYRIIAFWVEYASVIEKSRLADAQNGTTAATQSFSFLPSLLQPTGRREYSWEFLEGEGGGGKLPGSPIPDPINPLRIRILLFLSCWVTIETTNTFIQRTLPYFPRKPYQIPDHNVQSLYPFSDWKPYPLGQHMSYVYLFDGLYKGITPSPTPRPPPPPASARERAFNSWSFWIHMDPCLFSFFNHPKLTAELSSKMSKDRSLHGYLIY